MKRMQGASMAGLLVLACCVPWAGSADEAYVGGLRAPWQTVQAERAGGAVEVTVGPGPSAGGSLLLVSGKPDWMVLDDTVPPTLGSAQADGRDIEVGETLSVTAENQGPHLRVVVSDEANPVDPASLALTLGSRLFGATSSGTEGERLVAAFDLSPLGAGLYRGFLEACDMAPAGNALRVPIELTVNGLRRHDDGQTVTVSRGGHEYVLGGSRKGQAFLRFGGTKAAAYLSTEVNGKFVYARDIVAIDDLPAQEGLRLTADVIGIEDQDFGQIAQLEFDLRTDADFPGIILESRARNLDADGTVYCFWGWLPGQGFATADGEHEWSMTYKEIGPAGWVFLPSGDAGTPGIGVISALPFGESRFGTLLVYTEPTRIEVPRGEAVAMRLAFMLADSADEVAAAHRRLSEKGWPLTPGGQPPGPQ